MTAKAKREQDKGTNPGDDAVSAAVIEPPPVGAPPATQAPEPSVSSAAEVKADDSKTRLVTESVPVEGSPPALRATAKPPVSNEPARGASGERPPLGVFGRVGRWLTTDLNGE